MRSEPRGYWMRVFDSAARLLRARPELNGDQAYWLSRRLVDHEVQEAASAGVPIVRFKPEEKAPQ